MTDNIIISCLEPHIFEVQINDVVHENRMGEELSNELISALDHLQHEPTLKVLILSGQKKVFCAGGRLEFLRKLAARQADEKDLFELPNKLLSFPLPIIGAVEGHAVGGGLMVAIYCDMVVASESSRYGVNFTQLGFTPGVGLTQLLPALVGPHFANEMILTAKYYKGRDLRGRGLFNHIVPAPQVRPVAIDIARQLVNKPHHVLEMLKDTLSLSRRQALLAAVSREHLMHRICFSHPETAQLIEESYLS